MQKFLILLFSCLGLVQIGWADELVFPDNNHVYGEAGPDGKITAEGYSEAKAERKLEKNQPLNANLKKLILLDPKPQLPPPGKFPAQLLTIGNGIYFSKYAFIADKSTRTLSVWQNSHEALELVGSYPMDLGKKDGDKLRKGDHKTPEGIYFFQQTFRKNQLDYNEYGQRAFTMDYPNFFDKNENKTGSGIWLHAVPATKSLRRGSRGCLVVRNEIIEKLKKYVDLQQTPIIIKDKISYMEAKDHRKISHNFQIWLQGWKASWENKNIEEYIANYHENFKALKMNKSQWRNYKQGLNEKYESIRIKIFQPLILNHNDEYIVKFLQEYQSDLINDFGQKTLHVKSINGRFMILKEEWHALGKDLIAKLKK